MGFIFFVGSLMPSQGEKNRSRYVDLRDRERGLLVVNSLTKHNLADVASKYIQISLTFRNLWNLSSESSLLDPKIFGP